MNNEECCGEKMGVDEDGVAHCKKCNYKVKPDTDRMPYLAKLQGESDTKDFLNLMEGWNYEGIRSAFWRLDLDMIQKIATEHGIESDISISHDPDQAKVTVWDLVFKTIRDDKEEFMNMAKSYGLV
jgi:hypothetical protein